MDLIRLNPFLNVAANSRAVLSTGQLRGYSVHALIFKRGGTFTAAHMTNIRVRMGGKPIVDTITGTQLAAINAYNGVTDTTGYLSLCFGDPTARTIRGQHLGDLDLSVYQNDLEIQVDIGGATNPTLEVLALVSVSKRAMLLDYAERDLVTFRAIVPTQVTLDAAATRQAIQIAGGGIGSTISRIAFFHANLTKLEYKKQSLLKWEDVTIAEAAQVASIYGRAAQSGLYVLDRTVDGNQSEAETTVDSEGKSWNQQFLVSSSAADTLNIFVDTYTNFGIL